MSEETCIGKLNEPYFDEKNNRIKAFYSDIVDSRNQELEIVSNLEDMKNKYSADRITARFLLSPEHFEYRKKNIIINNFINQRHGKGSNSDEDLIFNNYEAIIPLVNDFEGARLIYYGDNKYSRKANPLIIGLEKKLITLLKGTRIVDKGSLANRMDKENINVEILRDATDKDVKQTVDLYAKSFDSYTVPLNTENVASTLKSPNNIIAVARNSDDDIVSICIAETGKLNINYNGSKEFKFAEITDAATHPEYRGKNIYSAASFALHEQLANKGFDLVYGETRSCNLGVNIAAEKAGRNFYGLLEKHCIISGHKDIAEVGSKYENLNVYGITQNDLTKIYGGKK